MKPSTRRQQRGYALMMVVIFIGASLLVLSGVMGGTAASARFTDRNNAYLMGASAADAAVEKAVGTLTQDYMDLGETAVYGKLDTYRNAVPSAKTESDYWSGYEFTDASGKVNAVSVERTTNWTFADLPDKFTNLKGNYAAYKVTSAARATTGTRTNVVATVAQELLLASIPIFAYQLFYAMDLELCPGDDFKVLGRVHCNGSIYFQPDTSVLTLGSDVTTARGLNHTNSPSDPVFRQFGSVVYAAEHDSRARVLKLPLGTNNTADMLHSIIESPPLGESATSLIGQQRFYNKADLIITVYNNSIKATSGSFNNFATTIPAATVNIFVKTNFYFYDKREGKEVRATELDVKQLGNQAANLKSMLSNRDVKIVYIADLSTTDPYAMTAVRLINGATLPTTGLTVATPNPMYVKGHYNTTGSNTGTTNTTKAYPGALVADAVTILSGNWSDTYSYYDFTVRRAANTTVNAAVITGIVPSNGGYYSGGVENSLRLLEDWTGRTFTFNGAIAVLYDSRVAIGPWGSTADVYYPPTRNWSWDQNFWTATKLPPGTPEVRTILRSQYIATQAVAK